MTTGLFGQEVVEPMRARQIPLFHEPLAMPPITLPGTTAADARIAARFDASATPVIQFPHLPLRPKRKPRKTPLSWRIEPEFKSRNLPYIAVDDAKKRLFGTAKLRSFHYVVYSKGGDNLLLFCGRCTGQALADFRQWQEVFGDGYRSIIATETTAGIVYRDLSGAVFTLDELTR